MTCVDVGSSKVSLNIPSSSGPASSDFLHALFQHPISMVTSPGLTPLYPCLSCSEEYKSRHNTFCAVSWVPNREGSPSSISHSHWYTLTHSDSHSHFLQKGYIAGLCSTWCPFLHICFLDSCFPISSSAWGYWSLDCRTLHFPLLNLMMILTFGIRSF